MRNFRNFLFATLIVSLLIAAPVNYVLWNGKQYRNFHVVEEGVLYRSAQLPLPYLERVVIDHRIRTIVCLRDRHDAAEEQEAAWVRAKGLNFVRIQPHPWFPDAAGNIPAEKTAKEFLAVMADPANYPVLVHCYAGVHRTGMMCALYRMDFQGWTSAEAEAEMRMMGYSMLDDHEDVLTYLAKYRPRHASGQRMPLVPVSRQIDARP